ncbi:hypothetical protein, conserved [Eimeria praecox]|uniref:BTB domain-containing protein n=1 Tax=Eimeria praecox TaxID=51316 RepID=U6G4E4_9EIME|nr:hypothetical protein, conserved [Eimeria praecox]
MGFFRPYDTTGEPRFFEVYGSSSRLAFSRYFVVAHVDGFLYVLDKYFCISRLVPFRAKRPCDSPTAHERRSGLLAGPGPPTRNIAPSEGIRTREQIYGRPVAAEQEPTGLCGYQLAAEEENLEGSQLLVPVRIADVISSLFRTDKPVFSQLLTGNNQYDQRQLQGLRQKSLLLSNRHDGCLYLFLKKFLVRISLRGTVTVVGDLLELVLKKFLVRISLRGTVTVVGDLLELALAAASRLRVTSSLGSTPGETAASASSSHPLRQDNSAGGRRHASSVRRVCSVQQFCREMGHNEDASCSGSDAIAGECVTCREMGHNEDASCSGSDAIAGECVTWAPYCENAAEGEQELEYPGSDEANAQVWDHLRSMNDWMHSPAEPYPDSSSAAGRLQEFVTCRGESWEVNNCCIDGEGRCFFAMARSKFLSPVEERGMIFCLDTRSPVARAVVLRFGRGVTQSAVISLSLAAHPNSGCVLMVAKSAAEVRSGILSPVFSPPSLATDCRSQRGSSAVTAISGRTRDPEPGARMNRTNCASAVFEADTPTAVARPFGTHDSNEEPPAPEATMNGLESGDALQNSSGNEQERAFGLQDTRNEAASDPKLDSMAMSAVQRGSWSQARHRPRPNNSVGNLQLPNHPIASRDQEHSAHQEGQQALEEPRDKTAPEEHSSWWFCPCDDDPSFLFPVAECFDDDAVHNAAQSICRQFRGSASSSVCRAYFEDVDGTLLREAKAAATAARTAEIMITAMMQTEERRDLELSLKNLPAPSIVSSEVSCQPERVTRAGALRLLKEADLAASRAECAECSGYILWQPGVKVRRPKTGEEAISFGSAVLFRARTKFRREPSTGWITGAPKSLQPPCASDLITGDLVAIISQDARHLEVRDAFPSPLGLIVIPTEAANRIVRQQPDGIAGRMTSRNSVSLTSFLASFIAGSSTAASERDDLGGAAAPSGQGSADDARPLAVESQLTDPPLAEGMAALSAYTNTMHDSIPRRAVPAVNIVFVVDTLRVCRLVETRRARGSWGHNGLQSVRDQRLPGLTDAATSPACEKLTCESSQSWEKNEMKNGQQSAVLGGLPTGDRVTQSPPKGGNSCSCRTDSACLGDLPVPVLHSRFADVTLLCADGYEVESHRALLAARCPFFEARLTRPHWEAREADRVVIDLRGFAGSVVQATVRFFETGYFVIPASCCCPYCCVDQQRNGYDQYQVPQKRGLPPHESPCCCRVDWVLQAYTFAAYCLLQDLKTELLAVLARLTSQRTCLHVLTHPAVRNQLQILQLAAHQLVHHIPMPNLLLELEGCREWDFPSTDGNLPKAEEQPPPGGNRGKQRKEKKPLLSLLLSEGIYDVVIKALSAWVLVSAIEDPPSRTRADAQSKSKAYAGSYRNSLSAKRGAPLF